MDIITIRFHTSAKTYDYLFENPNNHILPKNNILKRVTGCSARGPICDLITISGIRKTDRLPPHVTSKIILRSNGQIGIYKIKNDNNCVPPKPVQISVHTEPQMRNTVKQQKSHDLDFIREATEFFMLNPIERLEKFYSKKGGH